MTDDFLRRPKAVEGVPQVKNIEELSEWLKKNSDEISAMTLRRNPEQWLREHPDLMNEWFKVYEELDSFGALAAVLPLILHTHEADLAGVADPSEIDSMKTPQEVARMKSYVINCDLTGRPDDYAHAGPAFVADGDIVYARLYEYALLPKEQLAATLAAAHLAGRAAGREEAAKVADEYEDDARTIIASVAAEEIATAIRSLP